MIRECFNKFTVHELLYNIEWSEMLFTWRAVAKMLEQKNKIENEAYENYNKPNESKKLISKWKKPNKVSDNVKKIREKIERGEM